MRTDAAQQDMGFQSTSFLPQCQTQINSLFVIPSRTVVIAAAEPLLTSMIFMTFSARSFRPLQCRSDLESEPPVRGVRGCLTPRPDARAALSKTPESHSAMPALHDFVSGKRMESDRQGPPWFRLQPFNGCCTDFTPGLIAEANSYGSTISRPVAPFCPWPNP
jgi:hypothetical protein